jgi:hypothetical protein
MIDTVWRLALLMMHLERSTTKKVCCAGYTAASRTKDEPLLPLGMKDRISQRFDSISKTSADRHKTFEAKEGTG